MKNYEKFENPRNFRNLKILSSHEISSRNFTKLMPSFIFRASFYENFLWKLSMKISELIFYENSSRNSIKFGIPNFRAPQAHFPWVRLVVVVNSVGVRYVRKSGFEGTSGNEFICEALETHFVLFCSLEIWSRTFERILGFLWALSRS